MIKLIYGQDEYRAKKRLDEMIAGFLIIDPDKMNLEQLDGAVLTYGDFDRAISTMPFLAEKRMVIIANLLTRNKDSDLKSKIADRLAKVSADSDLIFYESGDPDKRISLFKKLSKKAEQFLPLAGAELDRFIMDSAKNSGFTIDFPAVRSLSYGVGADLNRIENELQKLSLYVKSQDRGNITAEDIDLLVESDTNSNVFHFVESLSSKNSKKAPEHLNNLIKTGENEIRILSMIIYQYRNLIILKDYLDSGEKPAGLAGKAKMHPFVVQKTLPVLKNYSLSDLAEVYSFLQRTDVNIKTGEIEPSVALLRVVAKLSM